MARRWKVTATLVMILFTTGSCGSATPSIPARLIPPRFRVRLVDGQIRPTRHQVPVNLSLMVDVYNDSGEEIVLKRLLIRNSPQTSSGILFDAASRIVDERIPPRNVKTVDIWIRAWVELPNLDWGSRTMVRGEATFDSAYGGFRERFDLPILDHYPAEPAQPR